jgi:endonuclease YncB( thermonuclease family)
MLSLVFLATACGAPNDVIDNAASGGSAITVLDGDTVQIGDDIVRIAGMDAAELPPWSECWAEAALAGASKDVAERLINGDGPFNANRWRVTNPRGRNERGYLIASLTRDSGEDFADYMAVYGYAARANEWDWCEVPQDLRDEAGPNLWFPPDDRHEAAHD